MVSAMLDGLLILADILIEWKGREDGIIAHVRFGARLLLSRLIVSPGFVQGGMELSTICLCVRRGRVSRQIPPIMT